MTILKGYEHSKGEMKTGRQIVDKVTGEVTDEILKYDSITLHYQSDDREQVKGFYCDNVRASADKLQIIGGTLDEMLNKQVLLGFDCTAKPDSNGRVRPALTSIVCLDAGGAKK